MSEQFQRDGRTVNHLPPTSGVGGRGDPVLPECRRRVEQGIGAVHRVGGHIVTVVEHLQDERCRVAGLQLELCCHDGVLIVFADLQVRRGDQTEPHTVAGDQHPVSGALSDTGLAGVVGTRVQAHLQPQTTPDPADPPHQSLPVVRFLRRAHRHEIVHLHHPVVGEESSDQYRGVGIVELLGAGHRGGGSQLPTAAAVLVQYRPEHAG